MCLDAVGSASSHGNDEQVSVHSLGMLRDPGARQVSLLIGRHEAAVFYGASGTMVLGRHFPQVKSSSG